jgi:hypothetical protein
MFYSEAVVIIVEIKDDHFFFHQDAASEVSSEDGKVNTVNYEEQLQRVLRDTPSPEEFFDEEFIMPPPTPPTPPTPKPKIPALTATEYFATRSPLGSPLPVPRKSSSLLSQTEDEPE